MSLKNLALSAYRHRQKQTSDIIDKLTKRKLGSKALKQTTKQVVSDDCNVYVFDEDKNLRLKSTLYLHYYGYGNSIYEVDIRLQKYNKEWISVGWNLGQSRSIDSLEDLGQALDYLSGDN